jgi:hypothetical protein
MSGAFLLVLLLAAAPPPPGDAASADAWSQAVRSLPLAPHLRAPTGTDAAKQSARPSSVVWEQFTHDPIHQRATSNCALFAEVAAAEVQYLLGNCDTLDPPPPGCPLRPEDDDPSAAGRALIRSDANGRLWIDLSEQLVASCSGLGYGWGGSGVWPFMNEQGVPLVGRFDPDRPYDLKYARTGWGFWQWLDRVGTVVEEIAPYALPYETFGNHDYAASYARLFAAGGAREPFPGTCPLVHRFGAGDPDGDGPLAPPEPFADDGCEIAQVAERAGAGVPVFFRVPLAAHRRVAEEDLLDYLAAGYVVVDNIGGGLSPQPGAPGRLRCDYASCALDEDCRGHVILLVGYESGGATLVVRDSLGSHYRIRRGACGHGIGELMLTFLGGDPLHPSGPPVTSLAAPTCSRAEHRELYRWLRDDSDGDGIRNGYDACLYSANPRLVDRAAAGTDPRIIGQGALLDPVFDDGDAWPDEREPLGDDEWDPALGLRSGCDSCPGLPVAQTARNEAMADGFAEDRDPWSWACDGCPFTQEWSYAQYLERIPTDENDPDADGIAAVCDSCPGQYARWAADLVDLDGDTLGKVCDPDDGAGTAASSPSAVVPSEP